MSEILDSNVVLFLVMTVLLFGGAAWAMGKAIADTWRPRWQIVPYALLMAAADRFLAYALAGADLLAPMGYVVAAIVMLAAGFIGWRIAYVSRMVSQYPWLYERAGPFAYRAR